MTSLTTTAIANLHQGDALPAARVVVVLVPLALLAIYLWLRRRP